MMRVPSAFRRTEARHKRDIGGVRVLVRVAGHGTIAKERAQIRVHVFVQRPHGIVALLRPGRLIHRESEVERLLLSNRGSIAKAVGQ